MTARELADVVRREFTDEPNTSVSREAEAALLDLVQRAEALEAGLSDLRNIVTLMEGAVT